jgi:hypothetical protein
MNFDPKTQRYLLVLPCVYPRFPHIVETHMENLKQIFPEKELRSLSPKISHSCVYEQFIYSAAGKYADRFWENLNKSITDI